MDGKLTRVEEQSPRRGGVATATRQGPAEPAGLGERESWKGEWEMREIDG